MDIHITGNPGTGNTYQEIHIGEVQNYNPNATTVINHNYAEKTKAAPTTDKAPQDAERTQRKAEILEYVARLKPYVAKDWKNRYDTLWTKTLSVSEVDEAVYEPGKQKNATFNRNLIANIIYIMCKRKVISEDNAVKLTEALEGDKDHSVRAQLRTYPANREITSEVEKLIDA